MKRVLLLLAAVAIALGSASAVQKSTKPVKGSEDCPPCPPCLVCPHCC